VNTRTTRACIPDADVGSEQVIAFDVFDQSPATSSLLLTCDRAFTVWGEDVYARFAEPVRAAGGPVAELKLDASVTYEYLYPTPPAEQPDCPIWTYYLDELEPDQELRVVFEKRRGADVLQTSLHEFGRSTGPGGHVGELRGSLS